MIKLDFAQLKPNTLLIFTDFAAVMALQAFETKNSSVDGHTVNDNFVCVPNRHISTVKETKKLKGKSLLVRYNLEVFDVDVHHYFEETYPKGKKTVHAMHNICLDNTINFYRDAYRKRNNRTNDCLD